MEYPSAHDFFSWSNTYDPDQDGFPNLYCQDFIHALSQVVRHKLARHQLDPYQRTTFQCSIVHRNVGEEEVDPSLEIAMEYAGAVRVVVFDKSCCLHDLMEAQVGRNQFAMDVVVDRLDKRIDEVDSRANKASERITMLEGRVGDMEEGYCALLALGQEQVQMATRACQAIASLFLITMAQQARIVQVEERMDAMREMILALEHM